MNVEIPYHDEKISKIEFHILKILYRRMEGIWVNVHDLINNTIVKKGR